MQRMGKIDLHSKPSEHHRRLHQLSSAAAHCGSPKPIALGMAELFLAFHVCFRLHHI